MLGKMKDAGYFPSSTHLIHNERSVKMRIKKSSFISHLYLFAHRAGDGTRTRDQQLGRL